MPERAVVFVDGNNWYHGLRDCRVRARGRLDYGKIAAKLVQARIWTGMRYYIGEVVQKGNPRLYAGQQRFLGRLRKTDERITVHFGRLEPHSVENPCAEELLKYLNTRRVRIDQRVFHDLLSMARRHRETEVFVEKAVDVMIAVDLVLMAERDEFDVAYLLSADGDYTPAVEAVQARDKKVFGVSAQYGHKLACCCNSFMHVPAGWFNDCYFWSV